MKCGTATSFVSGNRGVRATWDVGLLHARTRHRDATRAGGTMTLVRRAVAHDRDRPISGAHFNPAVTLADAWRGGMAWRDVPAYVAAQSMGAICGVAIANAMFGLPPIFFSHHVRTGGAMWLSEFVATFGLLGTIWGCARGRADATPFAVAAYIVGAYWFTSSTSFANPAVTIARSMSDTFAGIRPSDIVPFVIAQLTGAAAATLLFAWFAAKETKELDYATL